MLEMQLLGTLVLWYSLHGRDSLALLHFIRIIICIITIIV
jgi:hypothetical protein